MPAGKKPSHFYEFGPFRVDAANRLLLRAGSPVPLTLKAFDTLLVLVERSGEVVEKDELMRLVWPDTAVEENNLTQQISALRKALGEDAEARRFIETLPRRGYRFVAEVREVRGLSETAAGAAAERGGGPTPLRVEEGLLTAHRDSPSARRRGRRALLAAAVAAAVVFAVGLAIFSRRGGRPETPAVNEVAVLPFRPLAPGAGDVYLELGMADALITRLSNLRRVTVRPTSAVLKFTDDARDPVALGRQLGVGAVLDGRIQRAGEKVRVTAQLIRVSDGAPLWADTFDEEFTGIFRVQDSISERLADALALNLTGEERRLLSKRHTSDAEAYELYLRGRYHWFKWTEEGWLKARDYFEQAVEKDRGFALAYAGLADAYGALAFVRPPPEVVPKSREAALKALEIDGALAEAHNTLGAIKLFHEWDRPGAKSEFERALELSPNSALAHDLYAIYFGTGGQAERAIAGARRARDLDPLSPYMNTDLGMAFYYARRYDEALGPLRRALEIEPDYQDGLNYLAAVYEQKGMHGEAAAEWQKVLRLAGDAELAESVGAAYDAAGYGGALRRWAEVLEGRSRRAYVPPLTLAELYARLGERGPALAWLEKAYAERSPGLVWLKVEPRWEPFRGEERFQRILRGLNLAP